MGRPILMVCGVLIAVSASGDDGLVLTNKDVTKHKPKITVVTPIAAPSPATPTGYDRSRAYDTSRDERLDAERAEEARREVELDRYYESLDERISEREEGGFYRPDPDNENRLVWVDPRDEDFEDQLEDHRKERDKRYERARDDLVQGEKPKIVRDYEKQEPWVGEVNTKTGDVTIVRESDPRYSEIDRTKPNVVVPVRIR